MQGKSMQRGMGQFEKFAGQAQPAPLSSLGGGLLSRTWILLIPKNRSWPNIYNIIC